MDSFPYQGAGGCRYTSCTCRVCVTLLQVNAEREAIMAQIERTAQTMWKSGQVDEWFSEADPIVREVCVLVSHVSPDSSLQQEFKWSPAVGVR